VASIAALRKMEPRKLSQLVKGDLDWIVMKALEKDRARRYETANGFALDVLRYLHDEPVLACPPSAGYRFRKFARRNRGAFAAASAAMLVVLLSLVGLAISNVLITREKDAKTKALDQARTNEGIANEQRRDAQENLKEALAAVDHMLTRVGQERLAEVPQMEPVRRELLQEALTFYQRFLEKKSDDPLIRRETAWAYRRVADIHRNLSQFADAETEYRRAFVMFDELSLESPLEPDVRCRLILAHREFAEALGRLGNAAERDEQLRAAVRIGEELVQEFPENAEYRDELAGASIRLARQLFQSQPDEAERILRRNISLTTNEFQLNNAYHGLGELAFARGQYADAEDAYRQALDFAERYMPRSAPGDKADWFLGRTILALADTIAAAGRPSESLEFYARATAIFEKLAADFPGMWEYRIQLPLVHHNHAVVLEKLNLTSEAENAHRRAFEAAASRAADFRERPRAWDAHAFDRCLDLGRFLQKLGRIEVAQEVYARAPALLEKSPVDAATRLKHWQELFRANLDVGRRLAENGRGEQAEAAFQQAAGIQGRLEADGSAGSEQRNVLARGRRDAAVVLSHAGQFQPAERLARSALADVQAFDVQFAGRPETRDVLAHSHAVLAACLRRLDRPEESEAELRQALAIKEQLAADFPDVLEHRRGLATWYNELGWVLRTDRSRLKQAEDEHRRALALVEQLASDFPGDARIRSWRGELLFFVASALREQGNPADARPLLEQAVADTHAALQSDPGDALFRERYQRSRSELAYTLEVLNELREALPIREQLAAEFPQAENAWRNLGNLHAQLGQSDLAVAAYTQAIELKPDYWEAWHHRGWAQAQLGQWEKAIADLTKAIELKPDSAGSWHGHAWAHFSLGQWEQAVASYTKAIELNPDFEDTWHGRGWARTNLGHWDQAVADLTKAIELNPELGFIWHLRGWAHANLGQWDQALADLTQAVELIPNHWWTWYRRAQAHSALEQWEEAIPDYAKAIELGATDADVWFSKAAAHASLEQWDQALCDYATAIERDPGNLLRAVERFKAAGRSQEADTLVRQALADAEKLTAESAHAETHWRNLGNLHAQLGQWDQAVACYTQAIELKPDLWGLWHVRACVRGNLGQWNEALADETKAVELKPDSGDAWFGRGWALANLRQWDEAVAHYNKALELMPTHWWNLCRRGQALSALEQWDQAVADFAKAIELGATEAEVWFSKAAAHASLEQWDQALRDYTTAIERNPGNLPGTVERFKVAGRSQEAAQLARQAGDWKAALAAFDQSLTLRDGGDAFDWFFLAMAHWQLGDKEAARTWYAKALQWTEQNDKANEVLQRFRTEAAQRLELEEKTN
jgi:tetratricopeptide (TPR) repeat protein